MESSYSCKEYSLLNIQFVNKWLTIMELPGYARVLTIIEWWGVMRCWHGYLSEVQMVRIWSSWCLCHPSSLASLKSGTVLPFWSRLTQDILEKRLLNGCSSSSSSSSSSSNVSKMTPVLTENSLRKRQPLAQQWLQMCLGICDNWWQPKSQRTYDLSNLLFITAQTQ